MKKLFLSVLVVRAEQIDGALAGEAAYVQGRANDLKVQTEVTP